MACQNFSDRFRELHVSAQVKFRVRTIRPLQISDSAKTRLELLEPLLAPLMAAALKRGAFGREQRRKRLATASTSWRSSSPVGMGNVLTGAGVVTVTCRSMIGWLGITRRPCIDSSCATFAVSAAT